jgi:type IV/VI secretion system ImpK/VasF family protein
MDYVTELFRVASKEFMFLSAFRQKVRKGVRVAVDDVAADLEAIFREQAVAVREDPRLEALWGPGSNDLKARYILVVLADEILIHSGWESAEEWQNRIFEEKYFRTNIGGDQYFAIAKELQPDDVELAAIIFAGLALGYRGKFRERPEKLAEVRKGVFRLLSEYLATQSDKVTPEAYHVVAQAQKRLNPVLTLGRVAIVGFGFLFLYIMVTFLLWGRLVGDIKAAAQAMGAV